MTWDSWVRSWQAHSELDSFRMRVRRAVQCVQSFSEEAHHPLYAGISGGKDSVALAWILHLSGVDVQWAHAYTPLETPGMRVAAEATAAVFERSIDVIEPSIEPYESFWDWLGHLQPLGCNPFKEPYRDALREACTCGALLMMYCEQGGYRGYLTGMRSDESKGRLSNRKIRGLYYTKKDGVSVCNPLGDWSAADVWAAVVRNDLPQCPHYQLVYERMGTSPESPNSRVDMVVAPETATALPLMHSTMVLYPELYDRICQARPECRKD